MTDTTDAQHARTCAMFATACRPDVPIIVRVADAGIIARTPVAPADGETGCVEIYIDGTGAVIGVPDRSRVSLVSWQVPYLQMGTDAGRGQFAERLIHRVDLAASVVAGQGVRA